jgi:uncharacterized coiled-coil protein SlyX
MQPLIQKRIEELEQRVQEQREEIEQLKGRVFYLSMQMNKDREERLWKRSST